MLNEVLRCRLQRVVVFAAAVAVCLAPVHAGAVGDGPVLDVNFPDPDVVRAQGVFHAYATSGNGKNVQRSTSRDLVRWSAAARDAMPVLGAWVDASRGCGRLRCSTTAVVSPCTTPRTTGPAADSASV
jgi:arabinan endo-1,5-alpha-L-arabinosidase